MKPAGVITAVLTVVAAAGLFVQTSRLAGRRAQIEHESAVLNGEATQLNNATSELEQLASRNAQREYALFSRTFDPTERAAVLTGAASQAGLTVVRAVAEHGRASLLMELSGETSRLLRFLETNLSPPAAPPFLVHEFAVSANPRHGAIARIALVKREPGAPPFTEPGAASALAAAQEAWPGASVLTLAGLLTAPAGEQYEKVADAALAAANDGPRAPGPPLAATLPQFVGNVRSSGEFQYVFRFGDGVRNLSVADSAFGWTLRSVERDVFVLSHQGVTHEIRKD